MTVSWLRYYLWIAPHVLLIAVLVAMFRRKLHRQFPIFFTYTAFEILQFLTLFVAEYLPSVSRKQYYMMFSFGSAISTILRFGILYEVFVHVFRNYPALDRSARVSFRWAAIILLVAAIAFSLGKSGDHVDRMLSVVSVFDRTFSIVQCGLLLFLFLFSRYFSISWKSHAFGIALGFGIFASVELATSAIRSQVGVSGNQILDFVTMGTYHLCVLIWLFYMLAREQPPKYNSKDLPDHDLDTWNHELQRLIKK
jgi:hypothetical protein